MVVGIHHVQISVAPDEFAASFTFYTDLLGMTVIADPFDANGHWLAAGEQQVHLRREPDIDRHKTSAHAAFVVDNLHILRQRLIAGGFVVIDQPLLTGFDRFHTFDPSGNRIELMQPVALASGVTHRASMRF